MFSLFRLLLRHGVTDYQIKGLIEGGLQTWNFDKQDESCYRDAATWFLSSCTRHEAERRLNGLPTGTFLIRPSSAGHYALSITCNSVVNHCIIYEATAGHGYGFAMPFNVFKSLQSLVLHYSQSSLEEHNDLLTTTLKYPIFSPYIKKLQQQQQQQAATN